MTDEPSRHTGAPSDDDPRWGTPRTYRREMNWGFLPWLLGAMVVLLVATAAGLGTAYLVAQMQAAPPPLTALPDATPTPSPPATAAPSPVGVETPVASPTEEPTETPEPLTPPPLATPREHTVARGESLSVIAAEYGVTVESIIELNELENPNVIVPGQVLLIPPP